MDISLIFKVAGVGLLVGVLSQILGKYGREEQATFVGLAGILTVLLILKRNMTHHKDLLIRS